MVDYKRRIDLDDPAKPWRRVYETSTGTLVKAHIIVKKMAGFGRVAVDIIGAHCDASGKVLREEDGTLRIDEDGRYALTTQSDSTADVAACVEVGVAHVIEQIETAIRHEGQYAVYGVKPPPPPPPPPPPAPESPPPAILPA